MSNTNDGGPAFPATHIVSMNGEIVNAGVSGGMSLRAYAACRFMQEFLHGAVLPVDYDASEDLRQTAVRACEAADALIAELSRGGGK